MGGAEGLVHLVLDAVVVVAHDFRSQDVGFDPRTLPEG